MPEQPDSVFGYFVRLGRLLNFRARRRARRVEQKRHRALVEFLIHEAQLEFERLHR